MSPERPEEAAALDDLRGVWADQRADALGGPAVPPAAIGPGRDGAGPSLPADDLHELERAARALEGSLALSSAEVQALLAADPSVATPEAPPLLPEGYEVLEEIGRGGMGVVYRARDRALDRVVAVKVLRPGDLVFGQSLKRFEQEARVLARLRHPHIVAVHAVGEHLGRVYFTMDLVEGRPLSAVLRAGPLTAARAVALLRQVASAVAYVHAHGLVHRDLKPANILVDADDHVFVTDFGLALEVGAEDGLTLTGQVLGTPGYMSPEQARGDLAAVGEATDVYALGVLLYECLTGRRPFHDLSPVEQVYAVIHHEAPLARRLNPSAPAGLERVAALAMSKRPGDRYASARAFLADLERFDDGQPVRAPARGFAYRLGRGLRRHGRGLGWGAATLAVLALVLLASGAFGLRRPRTTLLAAADDLLARGSPEAAALLYVQAREPGAPRPDPDLEWRIARARADTALAWMEQERVDPARRLVESAIREARERAPASASQRFVPDGPLLWVQGTLEALDGRWSEARSTWFDAVHRGGWGAPPEASADDRAPWPADPTPWLLPRMVPALANPGHPGRAAACAMLSWWLPFSLGPSRGLPEVLRRAPDLPSVALGRAALECVERMSRAQGAGGRPEKHRWRDALDSFEPSVLESVLVSVARDEAEPPARRRLAASFLADRLDLPEAADLDYDPRAWGEADPAKVLPAYDRLAPLNPAQRLQARLELALEPYRPSPSGPEGDADRPPRPSAGPGLREWFADRSGAPARGSWDATLAWWAAHAADDPRLRLSTRLGLPAVPTAQELPGLAARLARAGEPERRALHHLLSLLAPEPGVLSPPRGVQRDGRRAALYWQARLVRLRGPHRLRLALLRLTPEGPRLDERMNRVEPVDVAGPFTLHHETSEDVPCAPRLGLVFPPGHRPSAEAAATLDLTLQVEPAEGGMVVRTLRYDRRQGAGLSSGSSSGSLTHVGFVLSPNLEPGRWSNPDPGRHEVLLALLEPDDGPAPTWDLTGWRARVADDVRRAGEDAQAAAEGEQGRWGGGAGRPISNPYLYEHQHTLLRLAMLGTRLPLPEAVDDLRRLHRLVVEGSFLTECASLLLRARLLAGDETLLHDEPTRAFLEGRAVGAAGQDGQGPPAQRSRDDDIASTSSGRAGEFWARLLAWSPSERLRAFATQRLEAGPLSERAAGDLLQAVREGRVILSPALAERVERGPTEDTSWWGQVRDLGWAFLGAALLALLAAGLLVRTLWPGLLPWQRLRPAGWLVLLGALLGIVRVEAAGRDHLPDDLGLLLLAVGAAVLGGHVHGWLRRAPAALLAASALLAGVERLAPLPATLAALHALLAAVGIACLPLLARGLRGHAPASPGLARPAGSGRLVGWPWPFALLYVLPVGGALLMAVLSWVGVPVAAVTLSGGWADLLVVLFGGAVLWAVSEPLRGAAARAAYLRLTSRPPERSQA